MDPKTLLSVIASISYSSNKTCKISQHILILFLSVISFGFHYVTLRVEIYFTK